MRRIKSQLAKHNAEKKRRQQSNNSTTQRQEASVPMMENVLNGSYWLNNDRECLAKILISSLIAAALAASITFFITRKLDYHNVPQVIEVPQNRGAKETPSFDENHTALPERISQNLSQESQRKLLEWLQTNSIWLPVVFLVLLLPMLGTVYQLPAHRPTLIITGNIIIVFGVFETAVFYLFDLFAAMTLPAEKIGLLQKGITLVSGVIALIQITVGINIFTQGLMMGKQAKKDFVSRTDIILIREQLTRLVTLAEKGQNLDGLAENQIVEKNLTKK